MESEMTQNLPAFKFLSGKNLMEYVFREDSEFFGYQLEMLAHNQIPGILKSEVVRVDGDTRLSFDITSLIPVKKLFERREIGRKEFLNLLNQFVLLLETLEEYLLDNGGIVFESSYIFINPLNLKLEFAYLPIKAMPRDLEPFKQLLLDWIIRDIRFANEPSDNYLQKLIEILKTRELTLQSLKSYINELETANFSKASIDTGEPSFQSAAIESIPIPEPQAGTQNPVKKTISLKLPQKSILIPAAVIGAFVLFGVVLFMTDTLSPDNPDFLLSLFGYLLIGGALCYLVYSKLFAPDGKQKAEAGGKVDKASERISNKTSNITIDKILNKTPDKTIVKKSEYVNQLFAIPRINIPKETRRAEWETAAGLWQAPDNEQDRTVILDAGTLKHPFLKRAQGSTETILLTHFPFMLGRLEEQVDYCLKNPAVGKLHAEIKKTEEGYFVTDMNTLNSTFLNGERLEPSKACRLENGAHITFANEEFIFFEGPEKP